VECDCWGRTTDTAKICPQVSSLGPNGTGEIQAGRLPATCGTTTDLSPTACFTMRFDGPDSSISCLIACRSSVAEITGNNSTRTQLKSRKGRIRCKRQPPAGQTDSWRHIQTAGTASVSQTRLSSNSIAHRTSLAPRQTPCQPSDQLSLAKYQRQVNVNARSCTAGAWKGEAKKKGPTEAVPFHSFLCDSVVKSC